MIKPDIVEEEFTLTLQYRMKIDLSTGELIEQKLIKRSVDKSNLEVVASKPRKAKKNESSEPQLILEENKICLNTAAAELTGIKPDDKIAVNYEMIGKNLIPVLSFDDKNGNKVTKSMTVAFRGVKHNELARYGTEFTLKPHGDEWILESDTIIEQGDENIDIEDIMDDDLANLLEDNQDITEIPSSFFTL